MFFLSFFSEGIITSEETQSNEEPLRTGGIKGKEANGPMNTAVRLLGWPIG